MKLRSANGVAWLEARLPGARVAFSTRRGGVSAPPFDTLNLGLLTDDDPESVLDNRRRLLSALGLDPGRVLAGRQVHGASLLGQSGHSRVRGFTELGGELPEADGYAVTEPDWAALVFVADCLPVAMVGPGGAAMLHCGWRGLAAGIIARGAEAVAATHAVVGPGIGPCCYEVRDDVRASFVQFEGAAERGMLNLTEVARQLLRQAGVDRVVCTDLCTSCQVDRFFSHRRDAGRTGRQAGLVWLEPAS